MSTAILDKPRQPAHRPSPRTSSFTGTLNLLRLYLRRDRIVAPLWILLLSVPLATVYVGSTAAVYPTAADRAGLVAAIMASPAQRAMYGNVYNDSLGAVGVWKAGMFHVLIAVAVILTVIRHTRADEEAGRAELLDSTAVGRYAGLTAALALTFGGSLLTGLIAFGGLLTVDVPAAGCLVFASALAGSGLVFSSAAAVAAQLSPSARTARGVAFAVLAAAFTLRAVGDAGSATGSSPLSWLSPLGWSLGTRPFAGDRGWVLLLHLGATAALTVLAYRLLARRDVGAGLLAERPGPGSAAPGLAGPFSLAWRLDRGALLLWTVGLCLYGLMIGSVVHGIGDEIGDGGVARDIVERLGGTAAMEQAFIAIAFSMLAMVASAFVISLTLRLHQEETAGRAETVLSGVVDRTRWLASHLVMAIAGSGVAMLLAGLVTGLTYGLAAGDIGAKLPIVLGSTAVQLPAVWLLAAVTLVLFGLAPRFTPVAWGVLVGFIALYMLGSLAGYPQWLQNLQPFTHIPHVGTGSFTAVPLLWLLAIDIVLIMLGVIAFRRRDLR
ncbi:MAG TPA: ABC transporter permease [Mycobacterium sp.]